MKSKRQEKNMKKVTFNRYEEIVEQMLDIASEGEVVYTICFLDDAIGIMRQLLSHDETTIGGINIAQEEYAGYDKEYFVSIDGDYIVDVEPAWHEDNEYHKAGYLGFDAEKVFVVGDANSAVIKCIDKDKCTEIEFDFSDDDIFKLIVDEDDNIIGFEINIESIFRE